MINKYKNLQKIYNKYLKIYNTTGIKPYPDKLLALLMLQEKDKYKPKTKSIGKFYNQYKKEINEKINKVITDFEITKQEIINYIEDKGISHTEEQYEFNKIWYVFSDGFGAVLVTQIYHPEYTPEQAYLDNCIIFKETPKEEKIKIIKRTLTRNK